MSQCQSTICQHEEVISRRVYRYCKTVALQSLLPAGSVLAARKAPATCLAPLPPISHASQPTSPGKSIQQRWGKLRSGNLRRKILPADDPLGESASDDLLAEMAAEDIEAAQQSYDSPRVCDLGLILHCDLASGADQGS